MASGPGERARLLALTRELILTRGVIDLSLSELARSIGSNNRMLLYHFGSLDELLGAAIDDILGGTELLDQLAQLLGSPGSAVDRQVAAWRHIAKPERLPHLPTVRTEAVRQAEIADRERHTPTCATSPRSWPPKWTTAPNGAARGASTTPNSRG